MSSPLENTLKEIEILQGATIEKIWIEEVDSKDELAEYDYPKVRMRVRYRKDHFVNGSRYGEFEIWQDVEGNGPGYISFVSSCSEE